jgi:gamma-glutamylputrescine oxidase
MISLSIWEKESFYAPQDIVIVGAGLMGLWTAYELKKVSPLLNITIVERNTTPLGASTRNAGFACFGSPTELMSDMETMGTDEMLRIVEMRYKGIEKIKSHFTETTIDYEHCGGYECINQDSKYWYAFDDRVSQLNKLLKDITGQRSIFKYAGQKMSSLGLIGFDLLVENSSEAALHSGKLVQALTQMVRASGVNILDGFCVHTWEADQEQAMITSTNGITIRSKKLVFCTNAFTDGLLNETLVEPGRGQIILTTPIPQLSMKGTFHFDEGFYYWRHLGDRILLGGARNKDFDGEQTLEMDGSATIKNALIDFLRTHIHPSISFDITDSWSGIMGFTKDKRPYCGYTHKGVYVALACNGMGVALTPMIAEKAADAILQDF